jgi:uncharacterized protein (DUF885 family)
MRASSRPCKAQLSSSIASGLHAFGWSVEQSVQYMMHHTAKHCHEATSEVLR